MKRKLLYCAIALTPTIGIAQPDHSLTIDVIEVSYKRGAKAGEEILSSEALVTKPTNDAGALLRSVNGVTAGRRGGLGFEPIIRGMSQSQLNVISNGAYSFGACPGRMDPPSTYVGFDSFDQVSVIKGNRSVIYGAGGSGGTVIFEHERPDLLGRNITGTITGASTSNSDLNGLSVDVAFGNDRSFVRLFGEHTDSGNYEDGDGRTVSSAYKSEDIGFIIGSDITVSDYLEFSIEQGKEDDMLYAGNSMDAPYADSESYRVKWLHSEPIGILDELELSLYRTNIDHLMDNYTERNRNMMPNGMAAESTSDTWGGRLQGLIETDYSSWRIGTDYRANDRSATLFVDRGKNGSYDMVASLMWPEVEQRHAGVFAEMDYQISDIDTFRLGTRYDRFTSRALSANQAVGTGGMARPAMLYQNLYGSSDYELASNDFGIVLGWDRQFDASNLLSVNLSRSVRTPDATENFIARNAMGSTWVGNPDINPEVHKQIDITYIQRNDLFDWSASMYWDEVDDYIERYVSGSANLYRNQKARIRGIELEASRDFANGFSTQAAVSYTRGDGDNGDLARISPLEGRALFNYDSSNWGVGAELVAAAKQTHFNYAVDVPEQTDGYAILNLYGHWDTSSQLTIEAGVENLSDETFAYHVNTAATDPFDPLAVRVNEPGRQFWLKARYEF